MSKKIGLVLFLIALQIGIGYLLYETCYTETELMTFTSEDGIHEVVLMQSNHHAYEEIIIETREAGKRVHRYTYHARNRFNLRVADTWYDDNSGYITFYDSGDEVRVAFSCSDQKEPEISDELIYQVKGGFYDS